MTSSSTSFCARACCSSDHAPIRDQVLLQPRDRIAQRKPCPIIGGTVLGGIVRGGMRARAVRDPFDQRGAEPSMRALGRPARNRQDREEVVAIRAQRQDAVAQAPSRKRGDLAPGEALERRDRPLVIDDVEDHGRLIDGGESERTVEIGLGRRAIADPGRNDARVALDRRSHRPAHGLDVLQAEIARDREEAVPPRRVHHRHLSPEERIAVVREELAHHVDERIAARDQDAAGGKWGSTCRPARAPWPARCRSPPRPGFACRTRSSSAVAR